MGEPFGLVVRFRLKDGAEAGFDQLVSETVEQIRAAEPGTLVYACHLVPAEPASRIFYELYRDRVAFDEHERQTHTRRFLAERDRYVASFNVTFLSWRRRRASSTPSTPVDSLTQDLPFPDRVAELRRRRGLSQRELGAALHRSESWVSQVERGVQPVERFAVLQALADALGVPVSAVRPETSSLVAPTAISKERPTQLDSLRLALAGHPALTTLFPGDETSPASPDVGSLTKRVATVWDLTHTFRLNELAQELTALLPELEAAVRSSKGRDRKTFSQLLARAYQAAAAAFAQVDDPEAAWIAADRSLRAGEDSGPPSKS